MADPRSLYNLQLPGTGSADAASNPLDLSTVSGGLGMPLSPNSTTPDPLLDPLKVGGALPENLAAPAAPSVPTPRTSPFKPEPRSQDQIDAEHRAAFQLFPPDKNIAQRMGNYLGAGVDSAINRGVTNVRAGIGAIIGSREMQADAAAQSDLNEAVIKDKIGKQASWDEDPGEWLMQMIGQSAPETAAILAGSAVGAKVGATAGAAAGPLGMAAGGTIGALVGGTATALPFFFGGNVQRAREDKGALLTGGEAGVGLAAAVPQAAADALLGKFLGIGGHAWGKVSGGVLARAGKKAAIVGGEEAVTEAFQQGVERGQSALINPDKVDMTSPEALREYLDAAIGGAALGGIIGGVQGAAMRKANAKPDNSPRIDGIDGQDTTGQASVQESGQLLLPKPQSGTEWSQTQIERLMARDAELRQDDPSYNGDPRIPHAIALYKYLGDAEDTIAEINAIKDPQKRNSPANIARLEAAKEAKDLMERLRSPLTNLQEPMFLLQTGSSGRTVELAVENGQPIYTQKGQRLQLDNTGEPIPLVKGEVYVRGKDGTDVPVRKGRVFEVTSTSRNNLLLDQTTKDLFSRVWERARDQSTVDAQTGNREAVNAAARVAGEASVQNAQAAANAALPAPAPVLALPKPSEMNRTWRGQVQGDGFVMWPNDSAPASPEALAQTQNVGPDGQLVMPFASPRFDLGRAPATNSVTQTEAQPEAPTSADTQTSMDLPQADAKTKAQRATEQTLMAAKEATTPNAPREFKLEALPSDIQGYIRQRDVQLGRPEKKVWTEADLRDELGSTGQGEAQIDALMRRAAGEPAGNAYVQSRDAAQRNGAQASAMRGIDGIMAKVDPSQRKNVARILKMWSRILGRELTELDVVDLVEWASKSNRNLSPDDAAAFLPGWVRQTSNGLKRGAIALRDGDTNAVRNISHELTHFLLRYLGLDVDKMRQMWRAIPENDPVKQRIQSDPHYSKQDEAVRMEEYMAFQVENAIQGEYAPEGTSKDVIGFIREFLRKLAAFVRHVFEPITGDNVVLDVLSGLQKSYGINVFTANPESVLLPEGTQAALGVGVDSHPTMPLHALVMDAFWKRYADLSSKRPRIAALSQARMDQVVSSLVASTTPEELALLDNVRKQAGNPMIQALSVELTTEEANATLYSNLMQLVNEGRQARYWYERSGKFVLWLAGGDPKLGKRNSAEIKAKADVYAQLLAIYSARNTVSANTSKFMMAVHRHAAGKPNWSGVEVGPPMADQVMATYTNMADAKSDMRGRGGKAAGFIIRENGRNFEVAQDGEASAKARASELRKQAPKGTEFAYAEVELPDGSIGYQVFSTTETEAQVDEYGNRKMFVDEKTAVAEADRMNRANYAKGEAREDNDYHAVKDPVEEAWVIYKTPYTRVGFTDQDYSAHQLLNNNKPFAGRKINNFFQNMSRVWTGKKQGVTADMWMARAFGFVRDAVGVGNRYNLIENMTSKLAEALGWESQQVQASIWASVKARYELTKKQVNLEAVKLGYGVTTDNGKSIKVTEGMEEQFASLWRQRALDYTAPDLQKEIDTGASRDFSDFLRDNLMQMSSESMPSTRVDHMPELAKASPEMQGAYHEDLMSTFNDENGNDMLLSAAGLLDVGTMVGPGYWQGASSPSSQDNLAVARAKGDAANGGSTIDPTIKPLLNAVASIRALLLIQDGVGYHRPFFDAAKNASNGVQIDLGRTITGEETKQLAGILAAELGARGMRDSAAGLVYTQNGMRVIDFDRSGMKISEDFKTNAEAKDAMKASKPAVIQTDEGYAVHDGFLNLTTASFPTKAKAETARVELNKHYRVATEIDPQGNFTYHVYRDTVPATVLHDIVASAAEQVFGVNDKSLITTFATDGGGAWAPYDNATETNGWDWGKKSGDYSDVINTYLQAVEALPDTAGSTRRSDLLRAAAILHERIVAVEHRYARENGWTVASDIRSQIGARLKGPGSDGGNPPSGGVRPEEGRGTVTPSDPEALTGVDQAFTDTNEADFPSRAQLTDAMNAALTEGPLFRRENTGTPEFKKWFDGAAKSMRNEDGSPKVFYHGTPHDFKVFDGRKPQNVAGFFTDDAQFAEDFADGTMSAGGVKGDGNPDAYSAVRGNRLIPVYLNLQKPFDFESERDIKNFVDEAGKMPLDKLARLLKMEDLFTRRLNKGYPEADTRKVFLQALTNGLTGGQWGLIENPIAQEVLRKLGHDGFFVYEGGFKNIGVFEPTSIKSVFNAFDPGASEDPLFRRSPGTTPPSAHVGPTRSPLPDWVYKYLSKDFYNTSSYGQIIANSHNTNAGRTLANLIQRSRYGYGAAPDETIKDEGYHGAVNGALGKFTTPLVRALNNIDGKALNNLAKVLRAGYGVDTYGNPKLGDSGIDIGHAMEVRTILDNVYDYLREAWKAGGGKMSELPPKLLHYFPQVWKLDGQFGKSDKAELQGLNRIDVVKAWLKSAGVFNTERDPAIREMLLNDMVERMTGRGGEVSYGFSIEDALDKSMSFKTRSEFERILRFKGDAAFNISVGGKTVKVELSDLLDNDSVRVLQNHILRTVRRAEFVRRMGADGSVFQKSIDAINKELTEQGKPGLTPTEVSKIRMALQANFGHLGKGFRITNPEWSTINSVGRFAGDLVYLTLAAWSSVTEVLTPSVRMGMAAQVDAFGQNIRTIFRTQSGKDMRDFAHDIGVIHNTMHHALMDSMEANSAYFIENLRNKFFKLNLLQPLTDMQRAGATAAAIQSLARWRDAANEGSAKHVRFLREIGLKASDLQGFDPERYRETSTDLIKAAIRQMVDETVISPSAAQRPTWHSDPRWALFAHIKGYFVAFNNTILQRSIREVGYGNLMPIIALAGIALVQAMLYDAREWVRWGEEGNPFLKKLGLEKGDPRRTLYLMFERGGLFGPLQPILDLLIGSGRTGKDVNIGSTIAPSLGLVETGVKGLGMMTFGKDEKTFRRGVSELSRLVPGLNMAGQYREDFITKLTGIPQTHGGGGRGGASPYSVQMPVYKPPSIKLTYP